MKKINNWLNENEEKIDRIAEWTLYAIWGSTFFAGWISVIIDIFA